MAQLFKISQYTFYSSKSSSGIYCTFLYGGNAGGCVTGVPLTPSLATALVLRIMVASISNMHVVAALH